MPIRAVSAGLAQGPHHRAARRDLRPAKHRISRARRKRKAAQTVLVEDYHATDRAINRLVRSARLR